jgi:hypothetical protein
MPPKQSASASESAAMSATESSWPLLKPRASIPPSTETESLAPVVRDAVAADEIAEKFFENPPPMPTPEPLPVMDVSPRRVAIDSAAVRARRRYLTRYVAGAVSVAGVIGLAAIVRVTTARDASAAGDPSRVASVVAASLPAMAPVEPAPAASDSIVAAAAAQAPAAADPPSASAAAADPPSASAAAADPPSASNVVPDTAHPAAVGNESSSADPAAVKASASTPAADAPPDAQAIAEARKARQDSQRALDRGHLAAAIEAGEQSVAIDPTDADAWLILGAAYQAQGHAVDARRCFVSCARQARRGARSECRALLR